MRRRVLMDSILGGGDMNKYESIFIGNGTQEITIPLDFEPDYIYVKRINQSIESGGVNGVYGLVVLRDMYYFDSYTNATTGNIISGMIVYDTNGILGQGNRGATYENGILTIRCNPAGAIMHNGEEYKIICGKFA